MCNLDILVENIEQYTEMIWKNDLKTFLEKSPELISLIMDIVPKLISVYCHETMEDLSDDALYWPAQVEKIVKLIEGKYDFVAIADALYFELRANILEMKEIMRERKIIIEGLNNE